MLLVGEKKTVVQYQNFGEEMHACLCAEEGVFHWIEASIQIRDEKD